MGEKFLVIIAATVVALLAWPLVKGFAGTKA